MNPVETRERLQQLAEEYQKRAEAIRRDLASQRDPDFAEQAQERQNDDVLRALLLEAEHGLRDVNHALERLAEGSYGQCARCGEAIGAARLQALPMAEKCVKCADLEG
ncbi:MAG TPA: TraR/DksA family transcriptional regulator [Pseudomonas sp.]|jgi:RNA polymerase-binding transcription factor DksA|uniref:TraR/DksA family transcriptional regulator n=1 Tax=Pseudomonas sp. TaxID=306 RepID=UPI002C0930B5|nr:TraR/DksA family transcriptional regulator [Pseudomonas sp.]HTO18293.1 TraR/DksA family transcriptional regulator [Pseudomonas sp.]